MKVHAGLVYLTLRGVIARCNWLSTEDKPSWRIKPGFPVNAASKD